MFLQFEEGCGKEIGLVVAIAVQGRALFQCLFDEIKKQCSIFAHCRAIRNKDARLTVMSR